MTDPRWSEESVELLASAWFEGIELPNSVTWSQVRPEVQESYRRLARVGLAALAEVGLLLLPGGVPRQIWKVRARDVEFPGSIICHTREDADRWMRREPNSPWQDEGSPQVLEVATKTEWPDGSEYTGKWEPVGEVG